MPKEQSPGKPTARRYSPEEKAAAVRMVRALRAELGTEQGTVSRVARPDAGVTPGRKGCSAAPTIANERSATANTVPPVGFEPTLGGF